MSTCHSPPRSCGQVACPSQRVRETCRCAGRAPVVAQVEAGKAEEKRRIFNCNTLDILAGKLGPVHVARKVLVAGIEQHVTVERARLRACRDSPTGRLLSQIRRDTGLRHDLKVWVKFLMLDRDGFVIEGVMSNVFALLDGVWCTPILSASGVAGVYREMLLKNSGFDGIPTKECDLTLAELYSASAIFVCNSLAGCVPVRQIEQQCWKVDIELMYQVQQSLSVMK